MTLSERKTPPVEDRIAIEALFARYAWTLDTGDVDGFTALFTPDGVISDPGGRYQGRGPHGVDGFMRLMCANPRFRGRQHWVCHTLFDGDACRYSALSFAMVTSLHITGATNVDLLAYYDDVVVKIDGSWLFEARIIRSWDAELLTRFPAWAVADDAARAAGGAGPV